MTADAPAGGVTRDAFLNGAVTVLQPADGYRAGLDAVLLAASLDEGRGLSIAEAGTGAGAALMCAAHRLSHGTFTGFEREKSLAFLAAEGAALNRFSTRVRIEAADIARRAADLENLFDQAFSNPPFFDPAAVRAPSAGRVNAYLAETPLREWALFLLHVTKPRGTVTIIHRAAALADVLGELNGRAGEIEVMPVRPAPGEAAHRILVRARKGLRKGPVKLHEGLTLHEHAGGPLTPRAQAAMSGSALEWR